MDAIRHAIDDVDQREHVGRSGVPVAVDVGRVCAVRHEAAVGVRGDSALIDVPADDHLERLWDEERQRVILRQALSELRRSSRTQPRTIEAFELLVWDELPAADVACRLGMSVDDVYLAKHRMIDRLRDIIAQLTTAYSDVL